MKKSFMLKSTSFVFLLALSQVAMAKSVGSVTFSTGDVTISHADKTITKAAKNAELNAGDAIETKEGRVQLSMIDGGKISLQPNTIYKINQFEFAGKEDGSEYNFTELVKGGLRTVSGLIGHKNRDHYQLKTAVATIGIRGTEFTVNFYDNNLLMTTNHGSVDVCNASGCLNAVTGQSIQVTGIGGAPKPSNKAAKAAAAPPPAAAGKAMFAEGASIDAVALTTTQALADNINNVNNGSIGGIGSIGIGIGSIGINSIDSNGTANGTGTGTGTAIGTGTSAGAGAGTGTATGTSIGTATGTAIGTAIGTATGIFDTDIGTDIVIGKGEGKGKGRDKGKDKGNNDSKFR